MTGQRGPVVRRIPAVRCNKSGPEEIDEQGNKQAPGQETAGKVQGAELRSYDEPHPEICRRHGRPGEGRYPPGGDGLVAGEADDAVLDLADVDLEPVDGLVDPESVERFGVRASEQLDQCPDSHCREKLDGGRGAPLSGFMDLACRNGFRER